MTTDGELVRQALDGREAACEELARRWASRVLAFCRSRIANLHTAEDLAQETLLRGLRALSTLEDPEKFGPWLRGIAVRVCLDWRKSKQSGQISFSTLAAESICDGLVPIADDGAAGVERADELRRLRAEVDSLAEEYREVLLLYYYHDVTYQELAEMLGVSVATVNARLTKARTLIRTRLERSRR